MMSSKYIVSLMLLSTFWLACIPHSHSTFSEFNVIATGARLDGKTDNSKAFGKAWIQACNSNSPSIMVIPAGKYILGQVEFRGPCKAPVSIRVQGTLQAPSSLDEFKLQGGWVVFRDINGLTISGGGMFDGLGEIAWKDNDCAKSRTCNLPSNLQFIGITNGVVQGISSVNSKMFHMNVLNCNNVTLRQITVDAPATSPNTDGIHIGRSSRINITDANIKTGDDCVSLGDGSQHINIEKVTCGPGHGISVGSLGKYHDEQPVVGVTVKNCTLSNTMNGVRVKTWPNSFGGLASGLQFEDIVMENVGNPILIDQNYCPNNLCQISVPSKVRISNVLFKDIKGTSATQTAVKLRCSGALPCQDVKLSDIELEYVGNEGTTISQCFNVKPTVMGKVSPPTCLRS